MPGMLDSYAAIVSQDTVPAVAVDAVGLVTFVNGAFERRYGWRKSDLLGKPLSLIIPASMREAHTIGFSRFLATEKPRLLGQPLKLPILHKDGSEEQAEHLILADRGSGAWRVAALIRP